jgi:hypothetical protein
MNIDDNWMNASTSLIEPLQNFELYNHVTESFSVIETHISWVCRYCLTLTKFAGVIQSYDCLTNGHFLKLRSHPGNYLLFSHCTGSTLYHLSISEQDHRRNTSYVKTTGHFWLSLCIQFYQTNLRLKLLRCLRKNRCHRQAGARVDSLTSKPDGLDGRVRLMPLAKKVLLSER